MRKQWMGIMMAVVVTAAVGRADEASEIRARTETRRPVIVALVQSGAVEEAPNGFLEIKDAAAVGEKSAFVTAENADRKKAYEAIAKALGVKMEEIAKRQAERLRAARGK